MSQIIGVHNLTKSFRGIQLFEDANLEVQSGERLAITGPNGSGKSVLFKIILGAVLPDQGEVTLASPYRTGRAGFPQNIGALIDRPAFRRDETGFENLWELAKIRRQIDKSAVRAAMVTVGLDPDNPTLVGSYSLGMKQKLGLAQTFMEGQQLLLLDEPFNALDKDSVSNVHQLLQKLSDEGRTIVFTSHSADDIRQLATREVQLLDKKIVPSVLK